MAPDDRAAGPVVPGFALHDVLARSGSATVYRATQVAVDRPVAVKVLDRTVDADVALRLRAEVRAVATLADHPHVVGVVDAGTTEAGAPFVATELVPAGSLGDRLRAFGPLPAAEVARVGAEVADALEAAHAARIVHGNVSPDNVLVGRRGRVLLTDFALAALAGPGAGERPDRADDVAALGTTLHTLLAGAADAPLPADVPPALADLIVACRAPDPAARPDLTVVATTLEAITARPPQRARHVVAVDGDDVPGPSRPRRAPAAAPDAFPTRRLVVVSVLIALSMLAAVVLAIVGDL